MDILQGEQNKLKNYGNPIENENLTEAFRRKLHNCTFFMHLELISSVLLVLYASAGQSLLGVSSFCRPLLPESLFSPPLPVEPLSFGNDTFLKMKVVKTSSRREIKFNPPKCNLRSAADWADSIAFLLCISMACCLKANSFSTVLSVFCRILSLSSNFLTTRLADSTCVVNVLTCSFKTSFSSLASLCSWLDLIRSDISLKLASSFSLNC
ncbi:hypothetical protein NQ317_011553 [Molorchus minor]|uniref:Uncharacterized protein n=1 Tax=Molorchus minor TaxID=1323400 RepID=A0ABQ9JTD1_9CUCU|nr:hypothetical protein NQ317_011553 [Molorchus minor]